MNKNNLGHVMIDLETMGNVCNSAIISIGAIEFDIKSGKLGKEFYIRIDLQSCLDKGFVVNGSTIYWWLEQSELSRKEICKSNGGYSIEMALSKLSLFMYQLKDCEIWANGASFDITILKNAYDRCGLTIPWDFRKERDVRTLVSTNPQLKHNTNFVGDIHHPIDDCKHQIKYCCNIWKHSIIHIK